MSISGFASDRLTVMHEMMSRHAGASGLPGLVTSISRGGETEIHAYGTTTPSGDAPMKADTMFRIASVTKPIVAAAAMTLVEDATLRLEDPVDHLLPELANRQVLRSMGSDLRDTVPADRPITLRDLLTLTPGYGAIFAAPGTFPIQQAMADAGSRGLLVDLLFVIGRSVALNGEQDGDAILRRAIAAVRRRRATLRCVSPLRTAPPRRRPRKPAEIRHRCRRARWQTALQVAWPRAASARDWSGTRSRPRLQRRRSCCDRRGSP